MLRNIRNIRNIFSLRGVINSDIPMVSRFVIPPCKGCRVSRRCLGQYPKLGRVHSQTSALIWCSGIRKRLRKLRKLRMQKRLTRLTRLT